MRRLTLALFVLLPLVAFARVGDAPTVTAGVPTDFTLSLDCDEFTAGVQAACTVPQGGSLDIEVVLTNNTASSVDLAAYNYELHNPSKVRLSPPPIFCSGTCLNSNPDFMLTGTGASDWSCGAVLPDNDTGEDGAGTSVSFIDCFNPALSGPALPAGSSTILGMVRYGVLNNGPAGAVPLTLGDVGIYGGAEVNNIGSCNPTFGIAMTCNGTTVTVAPVTLLIDCNHTQPGIQTKCYVSNTLATRDVDFVVRNNSNTAFMLGTFAFTLEHLDDARLFAPSISGSMDSNPDFIAQTGPPLADWACGPTNPDNDQNPSPSDPGQRSFISCFNGSETGPTIAASSTLGLGTVHYNIVAGAGVGSMFLTLEDASVFAGNFAPLGDCPSTPSLPTSCQDAEIVFYCQIDQADVVGTDGRVNSGDLGKVASVFGQLPAPVNEDQNFDGAINSGDLGLVASVFNLYVWQCP